MAKLSLTSLGGAGTVTGSKHLLTCGDTRPVSYTHLTLPTILLV